MQYYYLVAGLTEYPFDLEAAAAGTLRVDVPEVKRKIMEELTPADRRAVELLYAYYDILNIVGYVKRTKLPFNVLGNLSRRDVALLVDRTVETEGGEIATLLPEELAAREAELTVPGAVRAVVGRYRDTMSGMAGMVEAEELAPLSVDDLERELFGSFYRACEGRLEGLSLLHGRTQVPEFLRRWAEYDRMTRNLVAAYKGWQLGWPEEVKARMIVEEDAELREAFVNGQASDFGMRERFPYTEEVLQVLETEDFVERERRMDALRARMADDLAENDYFGVGRIMDYLIRLNILYRWTALEAGHGREEFRELVTRLTDAKVIDGEVKEHFETEDARAAQL